MSTSTGRRLALALIATLVLGLVGLGLVAPTADARVGAGPRSIILSPTAQPATSQTVSWRTTKRASGSVQVRSGVWLGTFPARLKERVSKRTSGESAYQYTATATGLRPSTPYAYRIVTSAGTSKWYGFRTPAAGAAPFIFLAFGDTQVANAGVPESIIDTALGRHRDAGLLLHAGDVIDKPWRMSEWRDYLQATSPSRHHRNWLVSVGNHEQCQLVRSCRSGAGEAFKAYYTWPRNGYPSQGATWFFTDYQGVRFVVLDTFGPDLARQGQFLDWALRTNPHRWSVVLEHAGPFAARGDRTNAAVRRHLLPVIKRHDVDLVLSGHDHSYARGYLGSANSTVFATSVSGKKFYSASSRDWRAQGATRVRAASRTATYQVVTVSGSTLTYRAVVAYKGRGASTRTAVGRTLDSVVITKPVGGIKTVR